MVALDRNSGRLAWTFPVGSARQTLLGEDAVYVMSGSDDEPVQLHKLRAIDGSEEWHVRSGSRHWESVSVTLGKYLYLTEPGSSSGVSAFDKSTGELVWKAALGAVTRSEALSIGDQALAASSDALYMIDSSGAILWHYNFPAKQMGVMLAAQENVAIATSVNAVGIVARAYAVDLRTGRETWRFSDSDEPNHVWGIGPPAIMGEHVYFLSEVTREWGLENTGDDRLIALHLSNGTIAWHVTGGIDQDVLAGFNGTLFLGNSTSLAAFDGISGKELWRLMGPSGPKSWLSHVTAGAGDMVYWAANNQELWAVSAKDGKVTGPTVQVSMTSAPKPAPALDTGLNLAALALLGAWRRGSFRLVTA